ncbi:MAG: DUF3472 domain-containing protein [Saprospiraceae bacterium]
MKNRKMILTLIGVNFLISCSLHNYPLEKINPTTPVPLNIAIPTAGNAWVMDNGRYIPSQMVTSEGIRDWNNQQHTIRTFFYMEEAGSLSLGIKAKVPSGTSKVTFTFGNASQTITLEGNEFKNTFIGNFQVESPGYYYVDLAGLAKEGPVYADVNELLLGTESRMKYVKDDFYFARRGPSVHLNFKLPNGVNQVEWFYSELTIPQNQDVIGSYFMANGFGEGYFGIQVNSAIERKILFSIWSPFQTDNPSAIPEDYKIKLLKKGAGVTTGEFGNEGSGGQSFKVFPWKAEVKYGFLVGAKPTGGDNTDYSAYFYDPESGKWSLIAQFRRPKTTTYLRGLYSFLENFIPDQGVIARKGLYQNQWAYAAGRWHELTKVSFTADNTARKEYRLDYSGGVENNWFYLKNCGFSNDKTLIDSQFERNKLNVAPAIDFSLLE